MIILFLNKKNQSHIRVAPHIIFEYLWGRENVGGNGTSESSHSNSFVLGQVELPLLILV